MENTNISKDFNLEDNFCKLCFFIFKNITLLNNMSEGTDLFDPKIDNVSNNCKFCAGVLNFENFQDIIEKINAKILGFDYIDYRITTYFTPLFHFLHHYVNNFL
jgi:hypothetical protein